MSKSLCGASAPAWPPWRNRSATVGRQNPRAPDAFAISTARTGAEVINVITAAGWWSQVPTGTCSGRAGLYAELYNKQFEGGTVTVQWCHEGGDVMADGSVRKWEKLPA